MVNAPQRRMKRALRRSSERAFTLVDILVSTAVMGVLMVVTVTMIDQVHKTYRRTQGKAEQFREARAAFEAITRRLSQATLNTYWDYDDPAKPTRYLRQSELRFQCGNAAALMPASIAAVTHAVFFQAAFGFTAERDAYAGMETMMNTWGYFIKFGDDAAYRPPPVNDAGLPLSQRFRLYEMMEPSETLSIYQYTSGSPDYQQQAWFQDPLNQPTHSARILAENVIALILLPMLPPQEDPTGGRLAPAYAYDSSQAGPNGTDPAFNTRHQLPPTILVTMVVIDDASARQFDEPSTAPDLGLTDLFQTVGSISDESEPGYAQDLKTLRDHLAARRINYRVFTSNVSISGAKWSRN